NRKLIPDYLPRSLRVIIYFVFGLAVLLILLGLIGFFRSIFETFMNFDPTLNEGFFDSLINTIKKGVTFFGIGFTGLILWFVAILTVIITSNIYYPKAPFVDKQHISGNDKSLEETIDARVPLQHSGHPNIVILLKRMDTALEQDDYAAVLHASASIFETMAKDIVGISTVQNQTLKSFFARYRQNSTLPNEILDYILTVYESRNATPLAGHGSTQTPQISREVAISLSEMTKAFVRIEYKLREKRT
ncbi:MAG TPA: hypothetical protein PKH77_28275, partial [Anaerolineae bacterium]|nr:hypothetical protein [Anaerolineae bacterium]